MSEEEGLIFRRHREWLESIGMSFPSNKCAPNSMLVNDNKLADVLISKYDYLDSCISNDNFDNPSLNSNLVLLLKFILENGPYLDSDINFREQIDMFFTLFRNLLRNHLKDLPDSINLLILRLIEIRACRWNIKPTIEEYYIKKIDKPSRQNVQPNASENVMQYCFSAEQPLTNNVNSFVPSGLRASKSYGDITTNYKNDDAMFGRHKQLKSNSKAVMKGEVVIKNSDSGKVMGIKGRRVHMIEEMSDTIISFQKVSSTARDRIVQISGQTIDNINIAKNLIDATIKQNTSPIPFNDFAENFENNINFQHGGSYANSNHFPSYNNTQSSSRNSLSDTEPVGHNIKVLVNEKETNIIVTDKALGEKLELFLKKFNFADFILPSVKEVKTNAKDRNLKAVPVPVASNAFTPRIVYDREFLLKFKCFNHPSPHVINDIKKNQMHLFRY